MKTFRWMAVLLTGVAVAACEKNAVQDITGSLPGARIRFANFGVNAPAVNFYANDTKVTAVLSTTGAELANGVSYGGYSATGNYSALEPGAYTFSGRISAATDKDLPVSTVTGTLAEGKAYSLYMSGLYSTTTKRVEGFIVEDPYEATLDYSVAYVRFVNAISNANPMILYAKDTVSAVERPVGGAVAYKSAGAFTAVPNGIYNLSTRYEGAPANVITRTAVTFLAGRVYTIGARGDITVVSTTATNRPFLDNTANR